MDRCRPYVQRGVTMRVISTAGWQDLWESFYLYSLLPRDRRSQLWFRGQPDSSSGLLSTLDRFKTFASDQERGGCVRALLSEFKKEAIRVGGDGVSSVEGEALELLARHYGLPSPLIDFTESPYIAAYFALCAGSKATDAAIWVVDRARLKDQGDGIDLIDDVELLSYNQRALRQKGVFVRVSMIRQPLEIMLDHALTKFVIPAES